MIRSDRGGEYEAPIGEFCTQHRIIHEVTIPYSPQSNGVVERKNRILKEIMNAMLISSGLPQNMWGEAILSSNYLLNKVPKKKLLMSYEKVEDHLTNTWECGVYCKSDCSNTKENEDRS